jgi:DNA mismatch endonuclease (patch repair protein)
MTDNLTKTQRSKTMSHIKSKWTNQEKKVHAWLSSKQIKHKMHPKIKGNPDILLTKSKCTIFINGCFWHGCPKCYKEPQTNRDYWIPKIRANKKRDRETYRILRNAGWGVKILWEHQLKDDFDSACSKLL